MEVVEAYHSKILKLEQAVLTKAHMKHVVRRKLRNTPETDFPNFHYE